VHIIGKKYIIAASGHQLHAFSLVDGSQISSWTCPLPLHQTKSTDAPDSGISKEGKTEIPTPTLPPAALPLVSDPPAKRRKVSDLSEEEASAENRNKKSGKSRAKQEKPPADIPTPPNVVALTSSHGGTHVIAVTGEDKTIRIKLFESLSMKMAI